MAGQHITLPFLQENLTPLMSVFVQLIAEIEDQIVHVAAQICVADPQGLIVDNRYVGHFLNKSRVEEALLDCRKKINELRDRPELNSLNGCVRAANGYMLAVSGSFGGKHDDKWAEALAVAVTRKCGDDLMPPSLVSDIEDASANLNITLLLQTCKLM